MSGLAEPWAPLASPVAGDLETLYLDGFHSLGMEVGLPYLWVLIENI